MSFDCVSSSCGHLRRVRCLLALIVTLLFLGAAGSGAGAAAQIDDCSLHHYDNDLASVAIAVLEEAKRRYPRLPESETDLTGKAYQDGLIRRIPDCTEAVVRLRAGPEGYSLELNAVSGSVCEDLRKRVPTDISVTLVNDLTGVEIEDCVPDIVGTVLFRKLPSPNRMTLLMPVPKAQAQAQPKVCGAELLQRRIEAYELCAGDNPNPFRCGTIWSEQEAVAQQVNHWTFDAGKLSLSERMSILENLMMITPRDDDVKDDVMKARDKLYTKAPEGFIVEAQWKAELAEFALISTTLRNEHQQTLLTLQKIVDVSLDVLTGSAVAAKVETLKNLKEKQLKSGRNAFIVFSGQPKDWKIMIVKENFDKLTGPQQFEVILEEAVHGYQHYLVRLLEQRQLTTSDPALCNQAKIFFLNSLVEGKASEIGGVFSIRIDTSRCWVGQLEGPYYRQPIEFHAKKAAETIIRGFYGKYPCN